MAFPSLLNARVLRQLASLSALPMRRLTKGAFFPPSLVVSTIDKKTHRVVMKSLFGTAACS